MKNLGVLTFLVLFSSAAFAQGHVGWFVGNGGLVTVCKDDRGRIFDIETYDLFEGRTDFGYQYTREKNIDPLELALVAATRLDSGQGSLGELTAEESLSFESRVRYVAQYMQLLPPGQDVPESGDAKELIQFPVGCELKQGLNFFNVHDIEADSDIWNSELFLPMSKAALYLHEAVYWYLRETGVERDSRRTRQIVSYLMAGGPVTPRLKLPPNLKRLQYCDSSDRSGRTQAFAYRDDQGRAAIQFLQLDAYRMLTKTLVTGLPKDGKPVDELPLQSGLPMQRGFTAKVDSAFDSDAALHISWGSNAITVAGVLHSHSAKDKSTVKDLLRCKEIPVP